MKRFGWILVVLMLATPAWAAKRVTVDQLAQMLNAALNKPDAELAGQLSDLELSERLSATRFATLKAGVPGEKAQEALLALADQSQFLDPSASEIPATAAPDFVAQRNIMRLVVAYVSKTIPQLPNVFANRVTTSFEDKPHQQESASFVPYKPLHFIANSSVTVLYRDGHEVVDAGAVKATKSEGLTTWGVFGPILGTVLEDAARSKLVWSHWEQGASVPLAVFSYSVPKEKSHYAVNYCCVAEQDDIGGVNQHPFNQIVAYHGEMAVDPASGTILRLMLEAELKASDPVAKASIVVEYGPVKIGEKNYICPVKSISLSRAQTTMTVHDAPLRTAAMGRSGGYPVNATTSVVAGPPRMLLNDAVYSSYHAFRAEGRMVAENEAEGASAPAGSNPTSAATIKPEAAATNSEAVANSAPAQSTEATQTSSAASEPASSAPTPAADSEISTAEVSGLPDSVAKTGLPAPSGFTLKSVSRLVDVGVVAYDKKGHPVKDLKQEDFEVYDNGVKQNLRYFSQSAADVSIAAPGSSAAQPAQLEFSNHGSSEAKREGGGAAANSTILLIDASNLAFSDLSYARGEMLRFLRTLPAGERVGLYILKSHGFQILVEETADHAQLEEKLSRWMPNAQDLARAQDAEQRNRQQFETVHSIEDLLYVNGSTSNDPEGHSQTLDPALRDWGSNPGRDAMMLLVGVARHLAAIPGHKNLVWVSSDNALVDWSNKAVSIEKGDKNIEPITLRAQEAMNDAHVSVYPLDASQLEGGMVDASIGRSNVELSPTTPLRPQQGSLGPEANSGKDINTQGGGHDLRPGRLSAQMQQDARSIQGPVRHLADATGGRVFRRSGGISGELNGVVDDGHASYQLSFYPEGQADGLFHNLTVKLTGYRNGVSLRYRTGYLYAKEPATLKERFQQAVWLPTDANQIAVTAQPIPQKGGLSLKITVAANDLALEEKSGRWSGNLDVFFVQRDDAGLHAQLEGKRLRLQLKDSTVKGMLVSGLSFEHTMQLKPSITSLRILVVDENSGRMGSVTIPAAALPAGD